MMGWGQTDCTSLAWSPLSVSNEYMHMALLELLALQCRQLRARVFSRSSVSALKDCEVENDTMVLAMGTGF